MWSYRASVWGVVCFAVAYPFISGSVLVRDWNSGIGEIYPIAPWALFCFVPNSDEDFAIRLRTVDGRADERPLFFEELTTFDQHQKTIAGGIIQHMGALAGDGTTRAFQEQRRLFERNYLSTVAQEADYELVRREFDVLERWQTGNFSAVEVVARLSFRADSVEQ